MCFCRGIEIDALIMRFGGSEVMHAKGYTSALERVILVIVLL